MIDNHLTTWFGLPVEEYEPGANYGTVIHRLGFSYDDEEFEPAVLDKYLSDPRAATIKAIVLGMPGESDTSFDEVYGILIKHAPRLTSLRGIFAGDILQEENEMSWIEQGDVGLLLAAFPNLEELRVRGGGSLSFTPCDHANLKSLIIETGGISSDILHEISRCSLPNLEHLEIWLGTDEYGWNGNIEDILPLLDQGRFPKLKSLGLRNSEIANEIAGVVANAPVIGQIESLDLSLGTMTDEGAELLLASDRIRKLGSLNLHRSYLTDVTIPRLQALGPKVDVDGQEAPDDWDGEPHYYVAVGE